MFVISKDSRKGAVGGWTGTESLK